MPTMTSWAAATAFLLALSCSPGAFGQGRTGWRYHLGPTGLPKPQACPANGCYYPGSGMQAKADSTIIDRASSSCTVLAHGNPCEYDSPAAIVPAQDDLNWLDCGNGVVDAVGLEYCPSPATINANRKSQLAPTCFKVLDFTFFETVVTIPPLGVVYAFTIAFDGMDDGSRITIFNSAHPDGLVVAGSYVYLGGSGTSNLKDLIVIGNNRVVITQVDDCTSVNNLKSAIVTLNGKTVSCGDCDDLDPCTTDYCSVDPSRDDGVCLHDSIPDAIAPEITCPADISADVDAGTCGAVVSFAADAEDNCPVGLGYTCDTPSGSTFPVGSTDVTCTATDKSGNNKSCQFAVTVTDATAPRLICPADISTAADAGMCGAVASFAADSCPLGLSYTCDTPSGSTFPVGSTTVTCTAMDQYSCQFSVTVTDAVAPELTCPADISASADAGTCGAVVSFAADAEDNCPVGLGYTCDTPSGSTFPVGSTTVTCTAMDQNGNINSCQFDVTVTDDEAPVVGIINPTLQKGKDGDCKAYVNYNAVATDNCALAGRVTCKSKLPQRHANRPGFPVGSHNVSCTATDVSGNSASRDFTFTTAFSITLNLP